MKRLVASVTALVLLSIFTISWAQQDGRSRSTRVAANSASASEIGAGDGSVRQSRTGEIGLRQIRSRQIRLRKIGSLQIRPAQVCPLKVDGSEARPFELCLDQAGRREIGLGALFLGLLFEMPLHETRGLSGRLIRVFLLTVLQVLFQVVLCGSVHGHLALENDGLVAADRRTRGISAPWK